MRPKLFQGIVAGLLVLIALFLVAPWADGGTTGLDLATANAALAVAGPGTGVQISSNELEAKDYPPGETPPGTYLAAPSLAKNMTPEWHKYAAMVDRVCATSWNYMRMMESRAAVQAYKRGWNTTKSAAASWRFSSDEDLRILQATAILGPAARGAGPVRKLARECLQEIGALPPSEPGCRRGQLRAGSAHLPGDHAPEDPGRRARSALRPADLHVELAG